MTRPKLKPVLKCFILSPCVFQADALRDVNQKGDALFCRLSHGDLLPCPAFLTNELPARRGCVQVTMRRSSPSTKWWLPESSRRNAWQGPTCLFFPLPTPWFYWQSWNECVENRGGLFSLSVAIDYDENKTDSEKRKMYLFLFAMEPASISTRLCYPMD